MKILHLNLKKKWFDLILNGEKKEEYREIKPYWLLRLVKDLTKESGFFIAVCQFGTDIIKEIDYEPYTHITFKNGYAKNAPELTIDLISIKIDTGLECWGAKQDIKYFVMTLGKIISVKNIMLCNQCECNLSQTAEGICFECQSFNNYMK